MNVNLLTNNYVVDIRAPSSFDIEVSHQYSESINGGIVSFQSMFIICSIIN